MGKVHGFVNVTRDGTCSSQRTVELRLSGLIGTACRPDMLIIRKNGFSLKMGYVGNFKFGCYYLQYVPASKPYDYY